MALWRLDESGTAQNNTRNKVKQVVSEKMEQNQERQRHETVIEMEEFPWQRQRSFDRQNEEGGRLVVDVRRIQNSDWVNFGGHKGCQVWDSIKFSLSNICMKFVS